MKTLDFFDEFVSELRAQLEDDDLRHGDTWLQRPRAGQEDRIYARFHEYYARWDLLGESLPWLKVAGNAFIAWIRDKHPEHFPDGEQNEHS